MKLSTWPSPPCSRRSEVPEIPEKISMFGIQYNVVDGHPVLDMPTAPLDRDAVHAAILKSYDTFMRLVATFDPAHLNELRDTHAQIIEALNKSIPLQHDFAVQEAANSQTFSKLELYFKVKKTLNK